MRLNYLENMMIDIILLAVGCGVFYFGFLCGEKYKTIKGMLSSLVSKIS